MLHYHPLAPSESKIIEQKGTEKPFSGEYEGCFEEGIYLCRKCDNPLYLSEAKFNAGCGWPSFDEAIEGHVETKVDGNRTEIICKRCKGHLGHVFHGEQLSTKNRRYCVNSLSLRFIPLLSEGLERAVFAGGCFWGLEYFLKKEKGVRVIHSGFIGGNVVNPTYEEVCLQTTGHFEAVELFFDPSETTYTTLLKAFFSIHDFTQKTGQGQDLGPQYLSAIFVYSQAQKIAADKLSASLNEMGYQVATQIFYGSLFYKADEHHQDYYAKKGKTPYCPTKRSIFIT